MTTIQQAVSEANLDAFKVWVATYSTKDRPEGFCRKPASIRHAVKRVKHMVEWGWSKRLLDDMPRNLKEFGRVNLPQPNPNTYDANQLVALTRRPVEPSNFIYSWQSIAGIRKLILPALKEEWSILPRVLLREPVTRPGCRSTASYGP